LEFLEINGAVLKVAWRSWRFRQLIWAAPTATLLVYAAVPVVSFIAITFARSSAPPGSAERDL